MADFVVNRPFSVTPITDLSNVGEGIQVTVVFQPKTVGQFKEDLILQYDTGETHFSLLSKCPLFPNIFLTVLLKLTLVILKIFQIAIQWEL